ncbi:Arrestin domain-containing protein 3 [Dermatophagoides farinae]|uniref:Arrestin domain-containing protein 3 n=1 Tax=Dermatophagoides farinae TaxID=6954 RepID=A0A922HLB0_DERFA|nr:Arrestin domain-containing protein 3 [Dermatophagoides farinae]
MNRNLVIKDVEIFLDRDRKIFEMGEMVHGKLRIACQGELHLSKLRIGIVCMSKIRNADDTFDQKKLLEEFYELPRAVSSQILRSGRHEIPFRFRLPDDSESPPSFDGRYGCINYFVECIIDKDGEPGSSLNRGHRYGVEIKLENPVRKSLMLSVSGSSEKDLGIFCFGSGSVSIEAAISRETIKLKTLINNTSTLKVQPRAALYQTQIFMSGDRHRTLEIVLVEPINGSEVDPTEVIEDIIEIPIPTRAQLTMKSSIITIKYFVHVTLDIPHNIDIHINLPIVITNKSAMQEARELNHHHQQQQQQQAMNRHLNSFDDKPKSRKILGIASKARQASTSSSNYDDTDEFE